LAAFAEVGLLTRSLSSTIIEDIQSCCSQNRRSTIIHFYFDSVSHEDASAETVVGTFVRQMVYHVGGVPSSLRNLYEWQLRSKKYRSYRRFEDESPKSLLESLKDELQKAFETFDVIYMVVDALDECKEEYLDEVLKLFKDARTWHSGNVQLLATSRNRARIRDGLEELRPLSVSVEEGSVQEDIRVFVHSRLLKDPRLRKWPESFRRDVENQLVSQAGGM
jgi:hypothetical protein